MMNSNLNRPIRQHGARFWIGITGVISGSLCLCLVLVVGFLYTTGGLTGGPESNPAAPTQVPQVAAVPAQAVPAAPAVPTQTHPPQATQTAPAAVQPTQAAAPNPTQAPQSAVTEYNDDFANPNSGWLIKQTDVYSLDYNRHLAYSIVLKKPKMMMYSIPPYPFQKPVQKAAVTFRGMLLKPGSGTFGALCNFNDNQNYYRVSISGDYYAVGKMVQGKWTELTSPYWQNLIQAQPDSEGYLKIGLGCFDGFIVLDVNGTGQTHLVDTDLTHGDIALYASSSDQLDADGFYAGAFFKDFSVSLQP